MGMAGLQGMPRRSLYLGDEFLPLHDLAGLSGIVRLAALAAFLYNIVMTVGLQGGAGILKRSGIDRNILVPASTT